MLGAFKFRSSFFYERLSCALVIFRHKRARHVQSFTIKRIGGDRRFEQLVLTLLHVDAATCEVVRNDADVTQRS